MNDLTRFCFVVCFAAHSLFAGLELSPSYQDISSLLTPLVQSYRLPGMAAAVINKNTIVAMGATGVRKKGAPEQLSVDDLFHIGSDTKSMTGTLIGWLVQLGSLRWDTKVTDIFPELVGKIHPSYASLTVEQLLTMRGGLPGDVDFWSIQQSVNNDYVLARQKMMEQVLAQPPVTSPGNFLYSNVSYIIAGHMAEKVANIPWESLIGQYLFQPLRMNGAGFGAPGTPTAVDQPRGHQSDGTPVEPSIYADNPEMLGPAGTVHVSLADWASYINLHLQGGRGSAPLFNWYKAQRLTWYIKWPVLAYLQNPVTNPPPSYASGWTIGYNGSTPILYHAGSNTLWYAVVWIDVGRDLAVLVVTNQGGDAAASATNDAIQELLNLPLN